MPSLQQRNQHLLWRAGFGPAAHQWQDLSRKKPAELYRQLRTDSLGPVPEFKLVDPKLHELNTVPSLRRNFTQDEIRAFNEKNKHTLAQLNLGWLAAMAHGNMQLRDRMALFWHGHLVAFDYNATYMQDLLNLLRKHALGNYRTLLTEVAQSAAMMRYLNTQQNVRQKPNENFARELMELFTLGIGQYTEKDIQEAARAFTGWKSRDDGSFFFSENAQDTGTKTVLGRTGNWKGEDILNILLEKQETARFIVRKLYRFLVNQQVDERRVEALARNFYKNKYEIMPLLDELFTSEWFYDAANIGTRYKSPVDLITGIRRTLPLIMDRDEHLLMMQWALGQVLLYPPNVAGWPGGPSWINNNTLIARMRIPDLLIERTGLRTGLSEDTRYPQMIFGNVQPSVLNALTWFPVEISWTDHFKRFEGIPVEKLTGALANALLNVLLQVAPDYIRRNSVASSRETYLKTATLRIMTLPEYQLC